MASIEIANTGYAVRFLKVNSSSNVSKVAGALTFCTTSNKTYLYLGVDGTSNAIKISSGYAEESGKTSKSITFQDTPTTNTNTSGSSFDGSELRYLSYTTIGAMSDKFRLTNASYANNTTSTTIGGTLTLTLNGVDTTNGTATTAYGTVSKVNAITCDFPKELSVNISGTAAYATNAVHADAAAKVDGEIKFITNSTPGTGYTLATSTITTNVNPWNGSSKIAINYATIGAAAANTAITGISWTTRSPTITNGVVSAGNGDNANAATITLTRANSNTSLTTNVPISLPINITGQAASVASSLTFTNYANAGSDSGTSYNGNSIVSIDISRNVVIAPFSLTTNSTTLNFTSVDIHSDSRIANIIITSGADKMTSAFSYSDTVSIQDNAGTLTLTCTAPTGSVSGYAIIVRGTLLSNTSN